MDLLERADLNDKFWHRLFEWLNVRFSLIAAGQLGRKLSLFSVGDDQEKCKQAVK